MIPHVAYLSESDNQVLIKAQTPFGPKEMAINCSAQQYVDGLKDYNEGALIQQAFAFLSAEEREFLTSGLIAEEWETMFPHDEEEDE